MQEKIVSLVYLSVISITIMYFDITFGSQWVWQREFILMNRSPGVVYNFIGVTTAILSRLVSSYMSYIYTFYLHP